MRGARHQKQLKRMDIMAMMINKYVQISGRSILRIYSGIVAPLVTPSLESIRRHMNDSSDPRYGWLATNTAFSVPRVAYHRTYIETTLSHYATANKLFLYRSDDYRRFILFRSLWPSCVPLKKGKTTTGCFALPQSVAGSNCAPE
jgi:hypothetical protein